MSMIETPEGKYCPVCYHPKPLCQCRERFGSGWVWVLFYLFAGIMIVAAIIALGFATAALVN